MNDITFEFEAIVKRADTKDHRGRIYPLHELQKVCEKINERNRLGELRPEDNLDINLSNASHLVKRARIEDGYLYCTFKILNTPQGERLKHIMDTGHIRPALRATGMVSEDGLVGDCNLITVDFYQDRIQDDI